jgi:hypothetical protein
MGTWGPAIFSDDLASDIRGDFRDLIGDGLDPREATRRLEREYSASLSDPDEAPVLWMALAASQWKLGRLLPEVRDRALQAIEEGADLQLWRESPDFTKRLTAEKQLRDQLLSEQPAPKRVPKTWRQESPLDAGQHFLYRHRSGQRLLFRVIDVHRDKGGAYPVVELLEWSDDHGTPSPKRLAKIPARKPRHPEPLTEKEQAFTLILIRKGKRDDPSERLELIGTPGRRRDQQAGGTVVFWSLLDDYLDKEGITSS